MANCVVLKTVKEEYYSYLRGKQGLFKKVKNPITEEKKESGVLKMLKRITNFFAGIFTFLAGRLRYVKITTRLLVSLLSLSLVPLVITGILAYNKSSSAITNQIKNYSSLLQEQLNRNIDNAIEHAESECLEIALNTIVQDNLPKYDQLSAYDKMTFMNDFNSTIVNKTGINSSLFSVILIINPDNVIKYGSDTSLQREHYEYWENKVKESKGTFWQLSPLLNNNNKKISNLIYVRGVPHIIAGSKNIGTIVLIYTQNMFTDIYKDIKLGEGAEIFIVDSSGMIISSMVKESIGAEYEHKAVVDEIKKNVENNVSSFDFDIAGEKHLVSTSPIKNTEWFTVSTIPYSHINSASLEISRRIQLISLIFIITALVLSAIISLSISQPLKKLVYLIQQAKDGNLSVRISDKSRDQIGEVVTNFNNMVDNIRTLILKVKVSSEQVMDSSSKLAVSSDQSYTASEQIAVTIQQIAEGASSQAEGVTESVGYMNNLSTEIAEVNNNVSEVLKVVDDTQKITKNAFNVVNSLNTKASEASTASERIAKDITNLNNEMKEIEKIIKVIVNISEQTNLLSLNAAIEAARAGEAGRGFAVVAGEVRKLADMSKESTITIGRIVRSILEKSQLTVEAANEARMAVEEQVGAVKETDASFRSINDAMENISSQMTDVNRSVKEMIRSREKTQESIEGISAVSEEAAATAQEVSASTQEMMAGSESLSALAKELNTMAQDLAEVIKVFTLE